MASLPRLAEAKSRKKLRDRVNRLKAVAANRRRERSLAASKLQEQIVTFWGGALDLLEDLLLEAHDIGKRVAKTTPQMPVAVRHTHHSLYGRGLLTTSEILALLRSGHGFGAYARWRTLFELSAFAEFIKDHGEEAAQRYRDYYPLEARKYQLARWPDLLDPNSSAPADAKALHKKLDAERDRLRTAYSARFLEDLGWAEKWFPNKSRFSIQDIVAAVQLDGVKSEYKYASYYVHAGSRGSLDHHRWTEEGAVLLCNPSDDLISRPGRLSAVSMALMASILVQACSARSTEYRVRALGELALEAEQAFVEGHRRWVELTGSDDIAWQE